MFTICCLEITVEITAPLLLDTSAGSALRGAFFRAIWERFCTNHEAPECRVCDFMKICPVGTLVAPLRDEGQRDYDGPRPYVISPPANIRETSIRYEQGESFTFGFSLIGSSVKLLPYVIRSFQEMEHGGLGHRLQENRGKRGSFLLSEIRAIHPLTSANQVLWQRGSTQIQAPQVQVAPKDIQARAERLSSEEVTINFLSPTRLTSKGRPIWYPDFSVLVSRLAERFEQLQHAFGTLGEQQDRTRTDEEMGREWYLRLESLARQVHLVCDETRWVDVRSYSFRQNKGMHIGGFIGRATFTGNLTDRGLRTLLVWGEVLRVGKNAVKGDGAYRIEI